MIVEWRQVIIIFAVSFLAAVLMVPVSKWIAQKIGAIDYPNSRRLNKTPIPRCGGIALYIGILAACFTIFIGVRFFGWDVSGLYVLEEINYIILYIGVTAMFTVGLIDDINQLTPIVKITGQLIAAIIVALSGVTIDSVQLAAANDYIALGWLDYPLTVLYFVAFVNVINLIDGLDGLAAGIVAIISSGLLYLIAMQGNGALALVCIALIAVCFAFLRFNFFPASIFMGDSGSHLLGLALGIVSIVGVVRTQSFVVMLVPMVIAGVPIVDTLSSIVRRLRGRQPVSGADTGHLHHRLLQAGLSQKRSVAVLWLCSAVLALTGCLMSSLPEWAGLTILFGLFVILFVVIWKLGLFKSVLRHHYANKGRRGPRVPRNRK